MSNKIKCKGCNNYILKKTARKYQGYSLQCLRKRNTEIPTLKEKNNQISEEIKRRLTAVLPVIRESKTMIWHRNWEKKIVVSVKT